LHPGDAVLCGGAIRNDANHISGPSRTGEGSFRALQAVIADLEQPAEQLAFVNVHGTATPYNDEMESIALERAGLSSVPINALKGYYGHTLGTAGVLETLLSIEAVRHGTVLATRGFTQLGVSRPVDIAAQLRTTARRTFVKLLSGFGGCNAAIRVHVMP
jgi:3-oxoacyl-[acyl-carrier-protein] synthase-1